MPKALPIRAFFDELSDAIANPSPSRPLREAVGVQGRKVCQVLSTVPQWARSTPGLLRDLSGVCAPYWDNEGISAPVVSTPGFSGGQCSGGYNVTLQTTNAPGSPIGGSFVVTGPILSGRIGQEPSGNPTNPIRVFAEVTTAADGTQRNSGANTRSSDLPAISLWLTRTNGQPDNCGDPPPTIEPGPSPAPNPPDLPVDERPFEDPVTGPQLPIPDLPSIPGLPGIPWRNPFAPGDPSTGIPGDPGDPGDPVDTTGPGDPAEGDAEPGSELIALKLTLIETPPFSQPLQNDVFRSVAFVYMGTAAGLDQDPAGALVRDGQLVYAEKSGLTRWRVAANVGFRVRVTPFYQEVN